MFKYPNNPVLSLQYCPLLHVLVILFSYCSHVHVNMSLQSCPVCPNNRPLLTSCKISPKFLSICAAQTYLLYRTMYSRYRNVVLGEHANKLRGTIEGERGGRESEESSVYCRPGTRVDGNSRHSTRRGFPSK
jgi:hypothetical protein